MKTIYIAGKVDLSSDTSDFRTKIGLNGGCNMRTSYGQIITHHEDKNGKYQFIYGGPVALSKDLQGVEHGLVDLSNDCADYPADLTLEDLEQYIIKEKDVSRKTKALNHCSFLNPQNAVHNCFEMIKQCDALVAFITSNDCYGTLVELGYANAFNIPIYLYFKEDCETDKYKDFWFVQNMENIKKVNHFSVEILNKPVCQLLPDELLTFVPLPKLTVSL